MTGTITLSPVVAADQDLHRQVQVTVNGTAIAPLDAIGGPVTFQCNAGDKFSVIDTDVNVVGPSAPSAAFTGTAALPAPTNVPATPSVVSVTFTA